MKGAPTKWKVGGKRVIRNERGSYIPPSKVSLSSHQDAAMMPILAAFGDKDNGSSAASHYDMLVKSDVSLIANNLIF
jgi:hypothetical protein